MGKRKTIWEVRLQDLSERGFGPTKLSQEFNIPISTLSDLKCGRIREPGYDTGVKIEQMHRRICQQAA